MMRPAGGSWRVEETFSVLADGSSNITTTTIPFIPYIRFLEKTDIRVSIDEVSNNGTDMSGSFGCILQDD